MALEGTIKDFGLPDIFQLIGLQRKTGILTLNNEKDDVTVTFENGMVVMADSSSKRLEDRLGSVLVKQGKLSRERLEDALATQKATLQRLGHILAANSLISPQDLRTALQVQVSQIVFKVFRWRDGEYHFAPTEQVDYDRDNFTPMSADFILMEGIRMVDEWPIIEKRIPSMDLVFRPVVDGTLIEVVKPGEMDGQARRASPSSKIRLTAQEELIFRKVDGSRTVQSIIDTTGYGEFETCRALFDLLNRNLITTAGRGAARAADTGAQAMEVESSRLGGWAAAGVVILMALVGTLIHSSTPFAVTGLPAYLSVTHEHLREDVGHARLQSLDRGVQAYRLLRGALPRTLEEVAVAGLVDRRALKDPDDRPYHYALTVDGFLLSAVDDAGRPLAATVVERVVPADRP
jgi:hypothetical protein